MVVAAVGAASIGAWADGALLILIFALSGTLEGYASARTKRDIEALMALHPDEALVVREDREVRVPASTLAVGDLVIVKPGERISADGRVVEGSSAVDQASITGESMPVDKHPGCEVFAGTMNGHGALRVVATRPAAETVLARIVQLVQEAEERARSGSSSSSASSGATPRSSSWARCSSPRSPRLSSAGRSAPRSTAP
jgi:Cd2+/Zn2+-exporting ATPase